MGPHAGSHLPRLAPRRVVSRDAGHARRGCARSESAPRRGPAHLPADPPVSSPAVVRRAARRQRAAAAPLLGTELRRLPAVQRARVAGPACAQGLVPARSEEHTSELQSPYDLVCRLLLEKKKNLGLFASRHHCDSNLTCWSMYVFWVRCHFCNY